MSNTIAGEIFEKIIQETINASQNDFEENGVQQQVLTELQQSWQHNMSQRDVAHMPWDPKPVPPPPQQQSQQPTPSPIPVHSAPPMQHQHQHQAPPNTHQAANGQSQVKSEAGQPPQQMQNYAPGQGYPPQPSNHMMAQQRAATLLQAQFGQQANASLNAMQQRGIALPGAPNMQQQQQQPLQQRPQGLQLPGQPGQPGQPMQNQQQRQMQAQYAQQMRQQTAHQQPHIKTEGNGQYAHPQAGQQHGVNYSQTDGADDAALDEWNRYMAKRRQLSAVRVSQNDRIMRREIEALRRGLENGLMLPLDEQKRTRSKKRVPASGHSTVTTSSLPSIPQLDGDAEEVDEDAINSDLDSSSDEAGHEGEGEFEETDHVLCTYDKVQRVKNKWKCTLKDGIMIANNKEYLFHKAQGEFEW